MGLWNWIKGTATMIAAPVVITANAVAHFGDGDGYAAAMDDYFESGFSLKESRSIDNRGKPAEDLGKNKPTPPEASEEEKKRLQREEEERLKKEAQEKKTKNSSEIKKWVKEEAEKKWEEQEEWKQITQKEVEQLKTENAQLAAKEKEAREKGDLTEANKHRAAINRNNATMQGLLEQNKNLAKSKAEIEKQLATLVENYKKPLVTNLNWGSYTTWVTIGGLLIAFLVIYYFAKKLWNKLKGE